MCKNDLQGIKKIIGFHLKVETVGRSVINEHQFSDTYLKSCKNYH